MTSSFVGYFFVPGPLGGLKSVPGDISDTLIPLALFSWIFVGGSLIEFFPMGERGGGTGGWGKNDQILKSVFFTCLSP